ncbi:ATP-binding protein [Rhodococcus gannanensis]|uniref:ATP-binding protein n=1 Tax=Rhodococcus gannanensis TaxID=1960308 RepID=A0ABW4P591_9NOCA
MPEGEMTMSDAPPARPPVEVRVRADYGQLPVLRAVAETIAVLADLNLDHVSDVKLAVDEIGSALVKDAAVDAHIICRFHTDDAALEVRVAADTTTDRAPDEHGFGWHVVRTVADGLSVTHEPLPHGQFHTSVTFSKSRGVT